MNAEYLVEFYGNGTNEWVGAFQNLSVNGNTEMNITLLPLAGSYVAEGDVNTSKIKINLQNQTGGAITSDTPHVEVYVKHSSFGSLHYIIESMTNGSFYLPILANATAKIRVFPNQAPPMEMDLNLSSSENNIRLITMTTGDAGLRRINESGELEKINVTQIPIQLRFLRATGNCDVLEPNSTLCEITSMNASNFNPLAALVAGKINMEMSIIQTGVTIRFMNYDMFSAKQPPMYSILNQNASSRTSSSTSLQEIWEFGSFAPPSVYDYVIIKIPYSDDTSASNFINDSWDINITIPYFYDENWNVIWNKTRGDTDANLSDEYLEYNLSLYRNFLTTTGLACSKTNPDLSSNPCYINTSANTIYLRIPHFSGIAPSIVGAAPSTGGDGTDGTTGTGTGTTTTAANVYTINSSQLQTGYSQELSVNDSIKFTIDNETHYLKLTGLTNTTATITVNSSTQQATLSIGEEKKFELTGDNFYDIYVKLNNITNNKANITIKSIYEEIPVSGPVCGNGIKESGEECDGTDLGGATCESLGFASGELSCTDQCTFDTSG